MNLAERIIAIAGRRVPNTVHVTALSVLTDDLGMDFHDITAFVMDVEDEFDVTIPDNKLPEFKIVQDIIDFVLHTKFWT